MSILSCNIPVVLDKYEGTGVVQSNTTNIIWCSSLLLRLHVSALSLDHHQVSNSMLEETIQCVVCNEISLVV